jgi:hypothetical protein
MAAFRQRQVIPETTRNALSAFPNGNRHSGKPRPHHRQKYGTAQFRGASPPSNDENGR